MPENCPNCGADIPPEAKACPDCGSCEATGWSEEAYASGLGLPDESFDYDEFVKSEFESGGRRMRRGQLFLALVGIALIIALLLLFL